MSKELSVVNNLMALSSMDRQEVRREMDRSFLANLVRKHPTLDQGDFLEFINKCQLTGADPRLNQVYLLVHNAWNSEKRVSESKGTTVFAYQFFIQMAQRTGELEGFGVDSQPDTYLDMSTGQERKSITSTAWCVRKGVRYEYKARFWEFAKINKNGELQGSWKNSYLMLEKCAVANVMRWAFPESLTGIYVSEEISRDGREPDPVKASQFVQNQALPADEPRYEDPIAEEAPMPEAHPYADLAQDEPEHKDDPMDELRRELVGMLSDAPDEMFNRLGKKRDYMIGKVLMETSLDGMKQKYAIIKKMMLE